LATRLVEQGLPAALVIPYLNEQAADIFASQVYDA